MLTREVLLFAALRQRWGQPSLTIEMPAQARARDLKNAVKARAPELAAFVDACRVAQDQDFVSDDTILRQVGELALIPPVSGGIDLLAADASGTHSRLTSQPLDVAAVLARVAHSEAGGINVFIGNVRRQSRGLAVTYLEYQAYPEMAIKAMDTIATAVTAAIPGSRIAIDHRIGRLEIGETAVIIAASAAHRAEAFTACRQAIEELKRDVPIWKEEFASDGSSWIGQGP